MAGENSPTERLRAAIAAGKTTEAIAILTALLERTPDNPTLHYNLGVLYGTVGDLARAVAFLESALRLQPKFPEACVAQGNLFSKMGDQAGALRSYGAALDVDPDLVEAHNNIAGLYVAKGDIPSALTHFLAANKAVPGTPVVLGNIAQCYEHIGHWDQAIDFAMQSLLAKPASQATTTLAKLLFNAGRQDDADRLFRQHTAGPNVNVNLIWFFGQLFIQLNQAARAIAAFDLWAERYPLQTISNPEPAAMWAKTSPFTALNPSPRYGELIRQYTMIHDEAKAASTGGQTFEGIIGFSIVAPYVREFCRRLDAKTLLDYGGGRGVQYRLRDIDIGSQRFATSLTYLGVDRAICFDPGMNQELPEGKFDAVICVDALEHCDRQDLPWIVRRLFQKAHRGVFANVASYPANKILPNGENAHCTVEEAPWWMALWRAVAADFPDIDYQVIVSKDLDQKRRATFGR